jgi:hypothetical protein
VTDKNHECYYCDGEGYGENRVDVDAWEKVCCEYCGGTGYGGRPAGDRDTSAPKFDALTGLAELRRLYAKERRHYRRTVEIQGRLLPSQLLAADQSFSAISTRYNCARMRAMRPVSRIAQAEMLARATICADMASRLR